MLRREAAAQVMEHICEHDAHGYSQPHRAGDGTIEAVELSDGSTVTIHGADYDCSEAVRMCYRAVSVLPYGSYMWTGNEDEVLTDAGFVRVPLSSIVRGDVLWRSGHTAIYLGNGKIGEAHHGDYADGRDGRQSDQDGTEVRIATYYESAWTRAYHYPEDGGTDKEDVEGFEVSRTVKVYSDSLAVRDAPSTMTGKVVARYARGNTINIDRVHFGDDGYIWGSYVGASSGKRRYIALGTLELAR